jgi:hypothetical protein
MIIDWLLHWVLVLALVFPLRWLSTLLHRGLFKVGWLVTKDLGTTTLLYYILLLPGIVVNQGIYWLAAGMLNVRADRALKFPDRQEVAELRHRFVNLPAKGVPLYKRTLIALAPVAVSLLIIYAIGHNVLQVEAAVAALSGGDLSRLPDALAIVFSAPDVWIWIYVVFALGNTMLTDARMMTNIRNIAIAIAVMVGFLVIIGAASQVICNLLSGPLAVALDALSLAFLVIITVDMIIASVLGIVESVIERITGDSATYEKDKLVAIRRADLLKQRRAEEEKRAKRSAQSPSPLAGGTPSVYKLPLPLAPFEDIVTIRRDETRALPATPTPAAADGRAGAAQLTASPVSARSAAYDEDDDADDRTG